MKLFNTVLLVVFISFNLLAQSYTNPSGTNDGAVNIYNVTFQGVNHTTPYYTTNSNNFVHDFYNDYTGLANGTSTNPGGSFSLSVSTWTQLNAETDYLYVWIDWNQDNDFDDAGENVVSTSRTTTSSDQEHTFSGITINVPPNPVAGWSGASGQYRMRVAFNYNSAPTPEGTGYFSAEFEDYALNINGDLPVELTAFTANVKQNVVNLEWNTATEVNNYGFEVERASSQTSPGQETWSKVGFVNGSGNSNSPKQYSYTDNSGLSSGSYSYRLKQIDNDGQFEYSKVVDVSFNAPTEFSLKQNYPNPFNPTTTISYSLPEKAQVRLIVYDAIGNEVASLVNQEQAEGEHNISFDASNLSSGIYFYKLTAGSFAKTMKMILLR